jgi:CRP/FNR family transcriptional regulator, nitrogen fixation regulation protein
MDRESFPSRESRIEWQHQCAPKDSRPKLADALALRTAYDRGQLIYDEGDPIECWYRIVSGMARRFTVKPDGRRLIVDLLLPGDAFGFGARDRHGFAAQAIGNGTAVARYSRARLLAQARSDAGLARELQAMAFEECRRLQDLILILGQTTAREKVGAFLLYLAERLGGRQTDRVVLPISRYDIADYLSLSVETVSRTLTSLKQSRLIAFSDVRHLRILDRCAMEAPGYRCGMEAPGCDPCSDARRIKNCNESATLHGVSHAARLEMHRQPIRPLSKRKPLTGYC